MQLFPPSALADRVPRPEAIAPALLAWYDRHHRVLPWRVPPGAGMRPDPYAVWLSEVMLQQTTVAAVIPHYLRFLARWPTVADLAASPLEELLGAWAGLGYYARARNLHRCATLVAGTHGGRFPDTVEGLRALPGIGAYTAAAIAAIAFDRAATVVDGNVERVVARLFAVQTPLPAARPTLAQLAAGLTPAARAGDYAQAMMDLGATVCTPRAPRCGVCPLATECRARALDLAASLPRRQPRAARPVHHGAVAAIWLADGRLAVERRPPRGLLGGMVGLPGTAWEKAATAPPRLWPVAQDRDAWGGLIPVLAGLGGQWQVAAGTVRHVFTHFEVRLCVVRIDLAPDQPPPAALHPVHPATAGLPTVMAKAATVAAGA